jgi:ribose 5-phosphate isomerase B
MKISIASDHGGVSLKSKISRFLSEEGIEAADFGAYNEDSCDYPDYAVKVAESVASGESDLGILICKTGIGMSIAANKVPGIRAALCRDEKTARLSREHNDANVLALAGETPEPEAVKIVKTWLASGFAKDESRKRHRRRVKKISAIEKKYSRPS